MGTDCPTSGGFQISKSNSYSTFTRNVLYRAWKIYCRLCSAFVLDAFLLVVDFEMLLWMNNPLDSKLATFTTNQPLTLA